MFLMSSGRSGILLSASDSQAVETLLPLRGSAWTDLPPLALALSRSGTFLLVPDLLFLGAFSPSQSLTHIGPMASLLSRVCLGSLPSTFGFSCIDFFLPLQGISCLGCCLLMFSFSRTGLSLFVLGFASLGILLSVHSLSRTSSSLATLCGASLGFSFLLRALAYLGLMVLPFGLA